jgi:hypothetical protein
MSLECELARVQMKRYLAGEELPSDLQKALEGHVRACASCRSHLNEQRLKLAGDLAGKKGAEEAKKMIGESPKPGPSGEKVFAPPHPLHGALNLRTLALSGCLAVVLFAMSAVAKDPSLIFGPKAGSKLPAASTDSKEEGHGDRKDAKGVTDDHGAKKDPHDSGHSSDKTEKSAGDGSEKSTSDHSPVEEKPVPADPDSHSSEKAHGSEPEPSPSEHGEASHQESVKKTPEPKPDADHKAAEPVKEPEPQKDLLVANEGAAPKIKTPPRPRPRVSPKSAARSAKASRRPTQVKRSRPSGPAKATRNAPPQAPKPASGIRVYDANGRPLK